MSSTLSRRIIRPRELSWFRALARRLEQGGSTRSLETRQNALQHLKWLREAAERRRAGEKRPDSAMRRKLASMVERYTVWQEPLAYVLGACAYALLRHRGDIVAGTQPFGELELDVRRPVLIPRSEVRRQRSFS